MNDFDYDVLQKKRTAYGAKHKVTGSKSRKCTLRTDFMTPSQIRKENGAMISYNINKPMDWKTFNSISPIIGKEYIERLVDVYNVNYSRLSDMFGVGRKVISTKLSKDPYNIVFKRGSSMTEENRRQWYMFLGCEDAADCNSCEETEVKEDTAAVDVEEDTFIHSNAASEVETQCQKNISDTERKMKMSNFSFEFNGEIDVNEIANSLRMIVGKHTVGTIKIICDLS